MASAAGKRRAENRTFAESFLSSEYDPAKVNRLTGTIIENNAHQSLSRMAPYLGLHDKDAVSKFFESAQFLPTFKELYDTTIYPRTLTTPKSKGPSLKSVQKAIADGENFGDQKYSSLRVDKSGWDEVDHYAFCLFRLCFDNTHARNGLFRDRQMSIPEKEVRLWMCMVAATARANRNIVAAKKRKSGDKFMLTEGSLLHDPPSVNIFGDNTRGVLNERASAHKAQKNSIGGSPRSPSETSPSHVSSLAAGVANIASVFDNPPPPFHRPQAYSPLVGLDLNQPASDQTSTGSPNVEEVSEELAWLKTTRNPLNPFDLTTSFGKYLTLQVTLKYFNDKMNLEKLVTQGERNGDLDAEEMMANSALLDKEINAISCSQSHIAFQPPTPSALSAAATLEALLDNPDYQPGNYEDACKYFGFDPDHPRFSTNKPSFSFQSWQVTGMRQVLRILENPLVKVCILADATGLGKTITICGVWIWLEMLREKACAQYISTKQEHDRLEKLHNDWNIENADPDLHPAEPGSSDNESPCPMLVDGNPHQVPEEPLKPAPPRPKMLIVLPELIEQWATEIRNLSSDFQVYIYHGDERTHRSGTHRKIAGKLTRRHPIFNGEESNSRVVVITSLVTLRNRHGPTALKVFRLTKQRLTEQQAKSCLTVNDPQWEFNLAGLFEYITVDEAHILKNADTMAHNAVTWLEPTFQILATATVLSNRIEDFGGYMKFIETDKNLWNDENLTKWGLAERGDFNPFTLPDDHPGAVLRLTQRAVERWITGPKKDNRNSGHYLSKIWKKVMIRRTYASPNPRHPEKKIAEYIAGWHSRRITCHFDPDEANQYGAYGAEATKKLVQILDNGKLIWNRKHSRQLILLSSWLGFHHVGEYFRAEHISKWKEAKDPLFELVKLLHKKIDDGENAFVLPSKDDVTTQLSIVCRGSPKLRALLKMIADLVVLHNRKIVIWCALPATQVFLHIIFKALGLESIAFTSELTTEERNAKISEFTKANGSPIFIGGFTISVCGFNLHPSCNHSAFFDTGPNKGSEQQAGGRIRRMGQEFDCENYEFSVANSFQNRQNQSNILKALPNAMAELSINLSEEVDETAVEDAQYKITCDGWYLLNGELIQAPDPRLDDLTLPPLSPSELVASILMLARGENIMMGDDTYDVEELKETITIGDLEPSLNQADASDEEDVDDS
ncbi:hypothetical protein ACHAP3_011196 [Botrytis cinerea]